MNEAIGQSKMFLRTPNTEKESVHELEKDSRW
jgi:hypothetical protein